MKFAWSPRFSGAQLRRGCRLCRSAGQALCRRGHEVHVYHCVDAFNAVRGHHPLRQYTPPPGLHLHPLKSRFGILSPLATQVTGRPCFKSEALRDSSRRPRPTSSTSTTSRWSGGPGVLGLGRKSAVRIMTAHEHWLICPMHLLWKYDTKHLRRPRLHPMQPGGRPAALRSGGTPARSTRGLRDLDALVFPSRHALEEHRGRGIRGPWSNSRISCPTAGSGGIEDEPARARSGRTSRQPGGWSR